MVIIMNTLIKDPNRGFHVWSIDQLVGHSPTGEWVPNRDDLVFDVPNKVRYKVDAVNYTTGISTLSLFELASTDHELDYIDYFITDGPVDTNDAMRIYIDYSLTRPVMRFDSRLLIKSSLSRYVRVYKGSNVSGDGVIISEYLDPGSEYISTDIPLEVAATPLANSLTLKVPGIGYCSTSINNGDILTAVTLDANKKPLFTNRMIALRTDLIRRSNSLNRYITSIALKSPAQRINDPSTLEIPVNATLDSISMMGVVNYSDGQSVMIPLTGNKFKIIGMEGYYSTIIGQAIPIVLEYRMSNTERSINSNVTASGIMTRSYNLLSVKGNGVNDAASTAYGVKIYAYPVWNNSLFEYSMTYWIHIYGIGIFNITPYVVIPGNQFDGKRFGIYQRYMVTVNLHDINPAVKAVDPTIPDLAGYIHYQYIDVSLVRSGDSTETPLWTVAYQDNNPNRRYGWEGEAAKGILNGTPPITGWNLSLVKANFTKESWLSNVYYNAKPLYNPGVESGPKVPTHVRVMNRMGVELGLVDLNTALWYHDLVVVSALTNGDVVLLKFVYRELSNPEFALALSAVPFIKRYT